MRGAGPAVENDQTRRRGLEFRNHLAGRPGVVGRVDLPRLSAGQVPE